LRKIVLLFSYLLSLEVSAQLQASAGKDRQFCYTPKKGYYISPVSISLGLSDTLGDNPSANGGIMPYTYRWTTLDDVVDLPQKEIDATLFLNSISISNPKLVKIPFKRKPFFLTVTDNLGNIRKDTMYVSITNFQLVIDKFIKKTNDTIEIYQQFWNTNAQNYYWQKKDFNFDTINNPIKVWNTKNDSLKSWAMDNYGCKSDTNFIKIFIDDRISIQVVSINELIANFHNPINEKSTFHFANPNNIEKINIYNNLGQKIYTQNHSDILELGRHLKEKGFYYIIIYTNQHSISPIKIQKE
jgi:hypothetical protein